MGDTRSTDSNVLQNFSFLSLDALVKQKVTGFKRYQDTSSSLFVKDVKSLKLVIVVTHIWEDKKNPDPDGYQFKNIMNYCNSKVDGDIGSKEIGVFYDYSCIPQKNVKKKKNTTSPTATTDNEEIFCFDGDEQKNAKLENRFKNALKNMLELFSGKLFSDFGIEVKVFSAHNNSNSIKRAWPLFELFISNIYQTLDDCTIKLPTIELAKRVSLVLSERSITKVVRDKPPNFNPFSYRQEVKNVIKYEDVQFLLTNQIYFDDGNIKKLLEKILDDFIKDLPLVFGDCERSIDYFVALKSFAPQVYHKVISETMGCHSIYRPNLVSVYWHLEDYDLPSYKVLNENEIKLLKDFADDVLVHGTKLALTDANITCNSDRDTMIKNFMKRRDSIIRKFWKQSDEEESDESEEDRMV